MANSLGFDILDDNVLIKIITEAPAANIKLLDGSNANEAKRQYIIDDFGSACKDIKAGQRAYFDTFCQRWSVDKEHFIVKRKDILAVKG